jgi:hypothetical protein
MASPSSPPEATWVTEPMMFVMSMMRVEVGLGEGSPLQAALAAASLDAARQVGVDESAATLGPASRLALFPASLPVGTRSGLDSLSELLPSRELRTLLSTLPLLPAEPPSGWTEPSMPLGGPPEDVPHPPAPTKLTYTATATRCQDARANRGRRECPEGLMAALYPDTTQTAHPVDAVDDCGPTGVINPMGSAGGTPCPDGWNMGAPCPVWRIP